MAHKPSGIMIVWLVVLLLVERSSHAMDQVSEQGIGDYWALLVGINDYQHWPPLRTPVADVNSIETILVNQYGVAPQRIIKLLDKEATGNAITNALLQLPSQIKPNDSVFIYYAGHGYLDRLKAAHWAPVDARKHEVMSLIPTELVNQYLANIPARHIFLVSDSCYSGGFITMRSLQRLALPEDNYFFENILRDSRQILTSGGLEVVADDGREGHSIFAYYFLRELRLNQQPYLSASALSFRVEQMVTRNAQQKPGWMRLANAGDEAGEFFFINSKYVDNLDNQLTLLFEGSRTPSTVLKSVLNRLIFQSGETAVIEMSSQADLYFLIVNRYAKDIMVPLFPNELVGNIIQAGKPIRFPQSDDPFDLVVERMPSANRVSNQTSGQTVEQAKEAFIIYAFPINAQTQLINWQQIFKPGQQLTTRTFEQILADLPVTWVSKQVLTYSVI